MLNLIRYLPVGATLATLALLNGCGGGSGSGSGSGDNNGSKSSTGFFLDSAVSGLEYRSPSHQGTTSATGAFQFTGGEKTTFSFAGMILGEFTTAANTGTVTPLSIVGATNTSNQTVKNMLVLRLS